MQQKIVHNVVPGSQRCSSLKLGLWFLSGKTAPSSWLNKTTVTVRLHKGILLKEIFSYSSNVNLALYYLQCCIMSPNFLAQGPKCQPIYRHMSNNVNQFPDTYPTMSTNFQTQVPQCQPISRKHVSQSQPISRHMFHNVNQFPDKFSTMSTNFQTHVPHWQPISRRV